MNKGRFNLFDKAFGDYEQDIVMTLVFDKLSNTEIIDMTRDPLKETHPEE